MKKIKKLVLVTVSFMMLLSLLVLPETVSAKTNTQVRVGTFNLAAGKKPNVVEMSTHLQNNSLEVVGVQEVDVNTSRNQYDMLERFVEQGYFKDSGFQKSINLNTGYYGNGVISTHAITEKSGGTLFSTGISEARSYQRSVFEKDGKKVAYYSTHLTHEKKDVRQKQMEELLKIMDNDPIEYKILTGDFNTNSALSENYPLMKNYNAVNGKDGVWHDTYSGTDALKHRSIDNIITSRNIKVTNVNMITSTLSDHNLLYADCELLDASVPSTQLLDFLSKDAKALNEADYTKASYATLKDTLTKVEGLIDDSSQSDIDKLVQELSAAVTNLKKVQEGARINYAIGGVATASDTEANWTAEKAIDGIVNREAPKAEQSRWSANKGTAERILTVDLKESRDISEFNIIWERENADSNIKGFKIDVSNDDITYTNAYTKSDSAYTGSKSNIVLDQEVNARYIKLRIDNYDKGTTGDWPSVSLYEFEILGMKVFTNLALDAEMTANASEATTFGPTNANDGIINREDAKNQSRWASSRGVNEKWLAMTFNQKTKIASVAIEWERCNATAYKIQSLLDSGEWADVATFTKKTSTFREIINFDAPVNTTSIRLLITKFDKVAETIDGTSVNWDTVSVFEFEAYDDKLPVSQEPTTVDQMIAALVIPEIKNGDTEYTLPSVAKGFTIEMVGADFEQILTNDLKIHQPLQEKNIAVTFKVSKGDVSKETGEYTISVPGKYDDGGTNAKPVVIPELAEWYGAEGNFSFRQTSRILVSNALDEKYYENAKMFAADIKDISGISLEVIKGDSPKAGDFYFKLDSGNNGLDKEGYIMEVQDFVTIHAEEQTGSYWATRSILQILKLNDNTIPKGVTRDYPKFSVRGFMLDVARKPINMETLQSITKEMAYYKMNDFQVHLNDNLIWMEDYDGLEKAMKESYNGFRLESNIKKGGDNGKNQADLTNTDLFYSKKDFRSFIENSRNIGVNIVPEFDAPGHAGAFIDVRPDLHLKELKTNTNKAERAGEQFDLSPEHYEDSLGFVTGLWDEYLTDDMFDESMTVNVGTDEYYGDSNRFRMFSDDIIGHVQETGRKVRLWGSLSNMSGAAPVRSEGVQMNIWNTSWANPVNMYKDGYDLINMVDSSLYIVPRPINDGGGYYADYLNTEKIYNTWKPNTLGSSTVSSGSSQMLGGAFALWNDQIDTRANGNTDQDIYDRFTHAVPALASKNWGEGKDITFDELGNVVKELDGVPGINPYYKASSVDETYQEYKFNKGNENVDTSDNNRDFIKENKVTYENSSLQLNGKDSYVETPLHKLATGNTLEFDITLTKDAKENDIIFEADSEGNEDYSHDIRIMSDGTLGFTRELYDFSFGYKIPTNKKVHIAISTNGTKVTLYVDGDSYNAVGKYIDAEGRLKRENVVCATLLLPIQRIGSKINAIEATIDNVRVSKGAYVDQTILDPSRFIVSSDHEQTGTGIDKAFDNNIKTHWHTQYSPYKTLPATIEIDMSEVQKINKISYLPRQDGGKNGHITQYSVYYKKDKSDEWTTLGEDKEWASNASLKTFKFDGVEAQFVKIVALNGSSDNDIKVYGAAAEFNIHKVAEATKVTIDKESMTLVEGESDKLSASSTLTGDKISWSSNDEKIAKVDSNGIVTAIDEGTTTVVATSSDGTSAECKIIVTEKPNIEVNKDALYSTLQKYAGLKASDYTKETWNVFFTAYKKASEIYSDTKATQEQVEFARNDLIEKAEKLKPAESKPVKDALYSTLQKYAGLKSSDYTKETWNVFFTAYKKASEIYSDTKATQEQIEFARNDLIEKAEKLKPAESKPAIEIEPSEEEEITQKPDHPVKTGDTVNMNVLLILFAGSGLLMLLRKKKKINL